MLCFFAGAKVEKKGKFLDRKQFCLNEILPQFRQNFYIFSKIVKSSFIFLEIYSQAFCTKNEFNFDVVINMTSKKTKQ